MPRQRAIPEVAGNASTVALPVLPVRDAVHFPGQVTTLHVARDPSLRAVRRAMEGDRNVLVLSQRDMAQEDLNAEALHTVGTFSELLQAVPLPDGSLRVALRGLRRMRGTRLRREEGLFCCDPEELRERRSDDVETAATMRQAVEAFSVIVPLNAAIPPEALAGIGHLDNAGELADAIAHHLPLRPSEKQDLLEELEPKRRLRAVLRHLTREQQILEMNSRIHQKVERELGHSHREFYLREQLRAIQEELREHGDRPAEDDLLWERIERAALPPAAKERAESEMSRLQRSPSSSPECLIMRTYLEWLAELPWATATEDHLDLEAAARRLSEDHYGLEMVRERILDDLAVRRHRRALRGPILCLVGPPGVGKTSVARSIAEALGRRFARISLGGVRDEAEIRGHRRTYVGAMPGRLISAIRQAGSRNPVLLLDEIDKMASDLRGDPAGALLEALDPEQNDAFVDHFLETPFDLSAVMFLATANVEEAIPAALRDRMEFLRFPAYTDEERRAIGRNHLWPRAIAEHGLEGVTLTDEALATVAERYHREAGVRGLKRDLDALCRKAARRMAESPGPLTLDDNAVEAFLGRPPLDRTEPARVPEVGRATGLVVGYAGGDTLDIEVLLLPRVGPSPTVRLTGRLGEVMKESAEAAISYLRAHPEFGGEVLAERDVHIHIPDGAMPKEGPSAGLTMAVALASAATARPVRADVALTGEITLRGRVRPVGGIRDKLVAADRAGVRTILIPIGNIPDLDDLPESARARLDVRPVATVSEALSIALGEADGVSRQ